MTFDRDRSGTVEPHELQQALTTFGYRLSPQALAGVVRRFSTNSKIGFDQFVGLCVKLRLATSKCGCVRVQSVTFQNGVLRH